MSATVALRRLLDIVLSALLIFLTLPIVGVTALLSAVTFRAWPIFCQERVGKDGKMFCCFKLRTLPTSVPGFTDKHDLANHDIPAFFQFLRRRHLDELPQLFGVLIGRMSLVGPRPDMEFLHEQMDPAFAALRTSVRPGCTGLWQISEASAELIDAAPEYDRFYVEHRSLPLDLWILSRTVTNMLGLRRGITLQDIPVWALAPTASSEVAPHQVIDLRDEAPAATRQPASAAS